MQGLDSCVAARCTLTYSGNVSCVNPCEHTAFCIESDFTNWPFDEHLCHFDYVSRTKDISKLRFHKRSMNVDSEEGWWTGRWKLLSTEITDEVSQHSFYGTNKSHSYISVSFVVERFCGEYLHQVMFPGVVVILANVVPMFLNPMFPERIILYIISLFSHYLYLEQLRWM